MIETARRRPSAFELPPRFWDDFVERYWDRQPCLIRNPFPEPLVDERELMAIMAEATRAYRAYQRLVSLAVFVDGCCVLADADRFLPSASARSLDDYGAEVESLVGDRPFVMTIAGLQYFAFDLWTRARWFLRPLFERVGFPAANGDLDTFFGRYDQSPGGVHKDFAANFAYVVSDRKTMLFWPDSYFSERVPSWAGSLRTMDYRPFAADAIAIEGRRGDVIFWPRSFWHVAVSDGGWPTMLTMGLYQKKSPHDVLAEALSAASGDLTTPHDMYGERQPAERMGELPAALRDGLRAFREAASGAAFGRAAERQWLERVSASGFNRVPPPLEGIALDDDDRLSAEDAGPLIATQRGGGTLSIGANGHVLEVRDAPHLQACVAMVRRGAVATVAQIVAACVQDAGGEPDADAVSETRALLHDLCRLRALRVATED